MILTSPLFRFRLCACKLAVESSEVAAVESSVTLAPASRALAPMVSRTMLPPPTESRDTAAVGSALTRTNTPLPLPAVPLFPRISVSAAPDNVPLCVITDEGASVMLWFATRMTSGALRAEPASSTVTLAVVAVTTVPSALALRLPPISRLSAPNALSEAASRLSEPASAVPLGPRMRMSMGLLISTSPPRPPDGACAVSEPSIAICRVASNSRRPESIGRRGTASF